MKFNLQPITHPFFTQAGLFAMSYETLRAADVPSTDLRDTNFTIYKDENLLIWIMLCPGTDETDCVELKQRFLKEGEECPEIEKSALEYAENWARKNNFKKIFVNACDVSQPYYEMHGYKQQGFASCTNGINQYKMLKAL